MSMLLTKPPTVNAQTCGGQLCLGPETYDPFDQTYTIPVLFDNLPAGLTDLTAFSIMVNYSSDNGCAVLNQNAVSNSLSFPFSANGLTFSAGTVNLFNVFSTPASINPGTQHVFNLVFDVSSPNCCLNIELGAGLYSDDEQSWQTNFCQGGTPDFPVCQATYEFCSTGWQIGGLVQTPPQLSCVGAINGGLEFVDVSVSELVGGNTANPPQCTYITNAAGEYGLCDVFPGRDYRIVPEKDDNLCCGITSADVGAYYGIVSCLVSRPLEEIIAADINEDGAASAIDALELQKILLFCQGEDIPFNDWDSWRFIPIQTYSTLPVLGCTSYPPFDPFIDILNISTNYPFEDFYGIKMGDIDRSCTNDCHTATPNQSSFTQPLAINWEPVEAEEDEYNLYFSSPLENIHAWDIKAWASTDNLEIIDFIETPLLEQVSYVKHIDHRGGKVFVSFLDTLAQTRTDQVALFGLRVKSKNATNRNPSASIELDSNRDRNMAVSPDGVIRRFQLSETLPSTSLTANIFPNPVMDQLQLQLNLQQGVQSVHVNVHNAYGHLMFHNHLKGNTSGHQKLDISSWPSGLYHLTLTTEQGDRTSLPFIKQ